MQVCKAQYQLSHVEQQDRRGRIQVMLPQLKLLQQLWQYRRTIHCIVSSVNFILVRSTAVIVSL